MRAAKTALARTCSQQLYFFVAKGVVEETWWGEGFPVICPCSNKFLLQNVFGHYFDWFSIIFPFLLHLNVHMDCPGNDEVTSGDPNLVRCLGGLLLFGRFFIIPSLG